MRHAPRSVHLLLLWLLAVIFACPIAAAPVAVKPIKNVKVGVKTYPALGKQNMPIAQVSRMFPLNIPSNTRMQVLRDQGPEFKFWLDRVDLDWRATDKSKNLTFRWSTETKNVKSAIWQVTIHRYSPDLKKWETPSGLVASGKVSEIPGAGKTKEFKVDFNQFAPKPGTTKQILPLKSKKLDFFIKQNTSKKPAKFTPVSTKLGQSAVKTKSKPPTAMHLVYYVRIVPLNAQGQRTGLPSAAVEVNYGDPPPQPYVDMSYAAQSNSGYSDPSVPANAPELNHPDASIDAYAPIQKDQPGKIYHYIVSDNVPDFFGIMKPGDKLDLTPHKEDKSWLDHIGDFFKSVVSFAEGALNWVATAYADIKSFAVSWAPEGLQGVLSAGLDIGLAAIGIPPTIPNFDELTSMGTDYLVKTAAEYAGVDPALAEMAVGEFMKATESQANCGGNAAIWLKPDPDYYYRPAYMTIQVKNNSDKVTDQVTMNVMAEPVGDKDAQEHGETVYYTACAFVPTLQPGESLSVPVFFEECMPLRWDDHGLQDGLHRFWIRYNSYPVKFSVSTYNGGKFKNRYKTQQTLQLEHAYYGYSGT